MHVLVAEAKKAGTAPYGASKEYIHWMSLSLPDRCVCGGVGASDYCEGG